MQSRSAPLGPSLAATLPPGVRIYAVGDVHGRADLLQETIARIDEDLARRPAYHAIEVYLGDYVDRGPDSKSVIDLLTVRLVRNRAVCLRGNHEAVMEAFLHDPRYFQWWRQLGGLQTLASYGIFPRPGKSTAAEAHERFVATFPRTHTLFLQCLRDTFCCGDFLFVHAGIRPGVPIEHQTVEDLHWIRDEFLGSSQDHGTVIVHGHTPVPHPDIRPNRINIDTGAWRSGTLTCIAIEGTTILVL